jgi:hypothetical protein
MHICVQLAGGTRGVQHVLSLQFDGEGLGSVVRDRGLVGRIAGYRAIEHQGGVDTRQPPGQGLGHVALVQRGEKDRRATVVDNVFHLGREEP